VTSSAGEDALVEQPAIDWLCDTGWTHIHGRDLAPEVPRAERKLWSDVVLIERLRQAVARINPGLPGDAVQRACELAMTGTSPSLIEDHRGFHELLTAGVPIPYVDEAGVEQAERAKLVDFENPDRNELLVVN
jgi:type I restriction enzyme R subunit